MPTYTIRDPQSGRTVKLTGDSPPTAAELSDVFAKLGAAPSTPPPASATTGMLDQSTMTDVPTPRQGLQWKPEHAALGALVDAADVMAEPMMPNVLKAGKAALAAIPTRAKAGAQFQRVMGKVGHEAVDMARPGDAALRIQELSERGASMPKAVRDLLKRATDPTKGEIDYREARDFYSNISRLSADEFQRLNPVVKMEVGKLRVALNRALAQTAAKGGQEETYLAAMKQYKVAARTRELVEKTVKWVAGGVGIGAAYKFGRDLLD